MELKRTTIIKTIIAVMLIIMLAITFCFHINRFLFSEKIMKFNNFNQINFFKPFSKEALIEMDGILRENNSDYQGFIYDKNILSAHILNKKTNANEYVYLVNEDLVKNRYNWELIKGTGLIFDKNKEIIPILVSGKKYQNMEIGEIMEIVLLSDNNNDDKVNIKVQVAGKVDNITVLQEYYKKSINFYESYAQGLIIMPDYGDYDFLFENDREKIILLWAGRKNSNIDFLSLYGIEEPYSFELDRNIIYGALQYTASLIVMYLEIFLITLLLIYAIFPYMKLLLRKRMNKKIAEVGYERI